MATRTSSATWEGNLKEGKGTMKVGRGAYEGPFSFASRFENGAGTNPEELIGAAEAGCFSMALSANLSKAGHQPKSVHTIAKVNLEMIGGGPKITPSILIAKAMFRESTMQNLMNWRNRRRRPVRSRSRWRGRRLS
jgi:osmotically inducible protein OsmC